VNFVTNQLHATEMSQAYWEVIPWNTEHKQAKNSSEIKPELVSWFEDALP